MFQLNGMAMEPQNLKIFISTTKDKVSNVLTQEHIGADAKNVIKDLLLIIEELTEAVQDTTGLSADTRMLKRKFDQFKNDAKAKEMKLIEDTKAKLLAMAAELKTIGVEAGKIAKSTEGKPSTPESSSLQRIKLAAQKAVEILTSR